MSLRRKLFYGLTLVLVAVLLVLPATGWLARLQLIPFRFSGTNRPLINKWLGKSDAAAEKYRATTERYPQDFAIQLASAMLPVSVDEKILRLEVLNKQFPHRPEVLSPLLRLMSIDQVRADNPEEKLLFPPSESLYPSKTSPGNPALTAKFIAFAKDGEQCDPGNAYFSIILAAGYFSAHQDAAAEAAWLRAASKPRFDEYNFQEVTADWKLQRTATGEAEIGYFARLASLGSASAYYGPLRIAARLATVKAVQAERAGDARTGFALRQATRKIGSRMIQQSKNMLAVYSGRNIVNTSAARPGGAAAQNNPYTGPDAYTRWINEKEAKYVAYLTGIGHAEEGAAFRAAQEQVNTRVTTWRDARETTYRQLGTKVLWLYGSWCADALLLTGALFSLAFAAIFKLVYRFSPRLQQGESLPTTTKWGLLTGLFLPLIAATGAIAVCTDWFDNRFVFWAGVGIASILLTAPPILLRFSIRHYLHGLLVTGATVLAVAGLVATGVVAWMLFGTVLQTLGNDGLWYRGETDNQDGLMLLAPWGIGVAVLLVPLSMLALFGVFSRMLRVPFAAGVTRGMRAMAVPLAAMLLLFWCGSFLFTWQQEREAIAESDRIVRIGEVQTAAERLHRALP